MFLPSLDKVVGTITDDVSDFILSHVRFITNYVTSCTRLERIPSL